MDIEDFELKQRTFSEQIEGAHLTVTKFRTTKNAHNIKIGVTLPGGSGEQLTLAGSHQDALAAALAELLLAASDYQIDFEDTTGGEG